MTPTDRLAERLLAHYSELVRGSETEEGRKAWDETRDLVRSDPEGAWRLIVAVLPKIPHEALTYLAAGPIEDLIDFFPEAATSRIESLESNEKLRKALGEIIVGPWVSSAVVARLRQINPAVRQVPQD